MTTAAARFKDNRDDVSLYKRLLGYLYPYRKRFLLGFFASIPASSLNGLVAFLMGPFIDHILKTQQYSVLFYLPIGIVGVSLIQGAFDYMSNYNTTYVGTAISQDLRLQLYKHLNKMDLKLINANSPGELMMRYYNDPSTLQQSIVNHLQTFITELFSGLFLAGVLFYRSWTFALVAIGIISFIFIPIKIVGEKLRKLDHESQQIMANIYNIFYESIYGFKVIQIFGLKPYQLKRFEKALKDYFGNVMRLTRASAILQPLLQLIPAIGVGLIVLFGSIQVSKGTLSPGEMTSFLVALILLYKPIKNVGNILGKVQRIFAPAERVFEKLDITPSIAESEYPIELTQFESLAFEKVSFAYHPEQPILKDINLSLRQGETIAFVGQSGGGKSTIIDLIPRFMDPNEGRVVINGHDVKDVSFASLASLFAIVTQETLLFDATIRENILLGCLNASEEQLQEAIQISDLSEFIESLPDGLNTKIGSRGVRLSGGQRQRIAIARAFLKNAPVLIFDEATSALDNESEAAVQDAMMSMMANKTVILIAHRLSTIRYADRIMVVEGGQIIEQGTHDELIKLQGTYFRLYALQFRHDTEYNQHLQSMIEQHA